MKRIPMTPASSSSITSHGYDPGTQTLAIQFTSGHTYHYTGVAPEDAQAFADAPSLGAHFHGKLRGKYDSTRIEEDHGKDDDGTGESTGEAQS